MGIFKSGVTPETLNSLSKTRWVNTSTSGLRKLGTTFLKQRCPWIREPISLWVCYIGEASLALAETLGSVGATLCVDDSKQFCVGLEINANHIKSVRSGFVTGVARPVHIGKKTQVWEIRIQSDQKELVCISRITIAVLDRK